MFAERQKRERQSDYVKHSAYKTTRVLYIHSLIARINMLIETSVFQIFAEIKEKDGEHL